MLDLDAIGDILIAADTGRIEKAQELRRRFEAEMRMLDDIGWAQQTGRESFEVTLSPTTLAILIEGLHRRHLDAVTRLAQGAKEQEAGTPEENAAALVGLAHLAVAALQDTEQGNETTLPASFPRSRCTPSEGR